MSMIAPSSRSHRPATQEVIDMEANNELRAVVQSIYEAVSTGDGAHLRSLLTTHDGLVFIGTDPAEWFEDTETVAAMLGAQAEAGVKVRGGDVRAFSEGTVGWAADQGTFVLPDGSEMPFRITLVFHREGGHWKLVQEHASVAIPNEAAIGQELSY
jgi:hypothetical protein